MDTSDDPATLLLVGGAVAGGMAAGGMFGGKDVDMPTATAEQATRTAEPVKQLSSAAKRNKRLAASMLTKDWGTPNISDAGLIGL